MKLHGKTIYEALGRHPVHPFPARMAPGIALEAISKARKPLRVLDPMMGSGTVVALARLKHHRAIGIDVDPLAILISKVWTTAIEAEDVKAKAREVQARAKKIFACMRQSEAYPSRSDRETRKLSLIISAIAQRCGLKIEDRRTRELPANRRYLPPPSWGRKSGLMASRMRREVVLSFGKPKFWQVPRPSPLPKL